MSGDRIVARPFIDMESVLARVDIVDIIGQQIALKRFGRTLKGLCPIHQERTPSFTVYPHSQSYYCFGCGASGNAVNFIMATKGMPFHESLCELAGEDGLSEMPAAPQKRSQDSRVLAAEISAMVEALLAELQAQLRTEEALAVAGKTDLLHYLDRNRWLMSTLELADEFAIAWNHCSHKSSEEMTQSGLVRAVTLGALKSLAGHIGWGRSVGVSSETEAQHWTVSLQRLCVKVTTWNGVARYVAS